MLRRILNIVRAVDSDDISSKSFNTSTNIDLDTVTFLQSANPKIDDEFETFFRLNGDSSNEAALTVMRDNLDFSRGDSGEKLDASGKMIDNNIYNNMEARDGSKSANTNAFMRKQKDKEFDFKMPDMPRVGKNMEDINVCMQAVYIALLEAGAPEGALNYAMRADSTPRETVVEFYNIAQSNNIALTGYIQVIDQALIDMQEASNIKDIAPVVGEVPNKYNYNRENSANNPDYGPVTLTPPIVRIT